MVNVLFHAMNSRRRYTLVQCVELEPYQSVSVYKLVATVSVLCEPWALISESEIMNEGSILDNSEEAPIRFGSLES